MTETFFEPIEKVVSRFVFLAQENIDTDQILPAKFLTTTNREGLGERLFYHWRFEEDGAPKFNALFNEPSAKLSKILIAGRNFGCGSSREHAPWALYDYGFRVIMSPRLGDIFRSNSLKNGLLAVEISDNIFDLVRKMQNRIMMVDLKAQRLTIDGHSSIEFDIDAFARKCLMAGADSLGVILANASAIDAYELAHFSKG